MADSEVASYQLGKIKVTITKTDKPNKLQVECFDGTYHAEFTVSRYEYQNYKRHMNQRIKNVYNEQYENNS